MAMDRVGHLSTTSTPHSLRAHDVSLTFRAKRVGLCVNVGDGDNYAHLTSRAHTAAVVDDRSDVNTAARNLYAILSSSPSATTNAECVVGGTSVDCSAVLGRVAASVECGSEPQ